MVAMQFIRDNLAVVLVCVVFAAGLVYFATRPAAHAADSIFSELSMPLKAYDGSTVRLTSYNTRPIIVYTWASWCPYCQDQFRALSAIKQKYGPAVNIIAINRAEPFADAKQFTDKMLLPPGIVYLLDPDDAFYKRVGGFAMPELLFIDTHLSIVNRSRGPLSQSQLEAAVRELVQ